MTMLAIDWGYALLVTGMGIGTVFLLLIVLIWVIGLQTKIINGITGHSKGASEEATVRTTEWLCTCTSMPTMKSRMSSRFRK